MRKSIFNVMELSGILFCMLCVIILRNVYEMSGEGTVGMLFGSVNLSVWEQLKPVILCYILYGLLELMCARPYFRQFVAAKAFGLYISILLFVFLCRCLPGEYDAPVTLTVIALGFLSSRFLTLCNKSLSGFFSVACFMLLLIFVMYFSFSAFPPRLDIFMDKESGMYGIIPKHIDAGAEFLSNI